ncbi:MAG: hypothetical protein OHK0012_02180 [Synechococcales cyanobacterium]
MMRQSLAAGLAALLALGGTPALANPDQTVAQSTPTPAAETTTAETIVDVAVKNDSFETLVAALKAAELVETLSGEGPFTVFAPTDEAFAALPEGTLDKLLLPENKDTLVKILTYHVVPGKVLSTDIKAGEVETVAGANVTIAVEGEQVKVNDATVVTADVEGSNGVIHVIDKVILPPDLSL